MQIIPHFALIDGTGDNHPADLDGLGVWHDGCTNCEREE
jgi:hypothetical protein